MLKDELIIHRTMLNSMTTMKNINQDDVSIASNYIKILDNCLFSMTIKNLEQYKTYDLKIMNNCLYIFDFDLTTFIKKNGNDNFLADNKINCLLTKK